MKQVRLLAVALVAIGLGLGCAGAHAQSYPNRLIKLIVPFTPGSPVDAAARVVVQHLQARLGQNVIVENRPGGGTTIGTKAVVTAAPDGYTLLYIGSSITYQTMLYPSIDYDPLKGLRRSPAPSPGRTCWGLHRAFQPTPSPS